VKVTVVPHRPSWRRDFAHHRARIEQALSGLAPVIDHIGSTSLEDIVAKPIIDILVGLNAGLALDSVVEPMRKAGYTYIEQFNAQMPYRRFFVQLVARADTPLQTILGPGVELAFGRDYDSVANIHVMIQGTDHWRRHLAFRDYLRAHPDVRHAYQALKLQIAAMDFTDPLEYNAYKEDFIARHQAMAIAWFSRGTEMLFHPITNELASSPEVQGSKTLKDVCASTLALYPQGPLPLPWVGYLAEEKGIVVGTCAYKSPPVSGEVEIAFFTFPGHEGRGVATRMAQHLIALAEKNGVSIRAQTLPESNASNHILKKLGFEFAGPVIHPEDGEVWEWRR